MESTEKINRTSARDKLPGTIMQTRDHTDTGLFRELVPALLQSSQSVFYIVQDRKFQVVTEHLIRLTGFSQEELLGTDPLSVVHPDDRNMVRENAVMMLKSKRTEPYEFRLFDKAGNTKHIMEAVTSIMYNGKLATLGNWVDLTERKRAEKALLESEAKYRAIFEQAVDSIALIDPETGAIQDFNDKAYQNLGYTRKEFAKIKMQDIDPNLDRDNGREVRNNSLIEDGMAVFETKHRTKSGEMRDVRVTATLFRLNGNKLIMCIWHDITERKRVENELVESEQRFRAMFDNSIDGISVTDLETRTLYMCNRAFSQMLGYTPEEIKNLEISDLHLEKDLSRVMANIEREAHGESPGIDEVHLKKKDGSILLAEISPSLVAFGGKKYLACFFRDVTEQKARERQLIESEMKYRSIFESANDIILLLDRKGNILDINGKVKEIAGYEREELIGRDFRTLARIVTKKSMAKISFNFAKRLADVKVPPYEAEMYNKNGETINIEINAVSLKINGKIAGDLAIIRNITQQKRSLQVIEENEEKFSTAFQSNPNPCFITSLKDGKFIEVNDSFSRITGHTKKEVINKTARSINLWDGEGASQKIPPILRKHRRVIGEDITFKTKTGEIRRGIYSAEIIKLGGDDCVLTTVNDVTERRQAEEKLKESEEFSSGLMKSSAVPILVVNDDTSLKYVNPAFEKLTGFTSQEIVGTAAPYPWWMGSKSSGNVDELKSDVHKGVSRLEKFFQKKTGEPFWVEITSAPVKCDGKFLYSIENWLDITERKQTEEALRENEEKYRAIFGQASDSIILIDEETEEFVDFNDRAHQNLGYTREEFSKLKATDIDAAQSHDEIIKHRKNMREEGLDVFETRQRTKNGQIRHVLVSIKPLNISGKIFSLSVSHDITERKNMEDELRTHKDHLEELVNKRTAQLNSLNKQLEKELEERKRIEDELLVAIHNADEANKAKSSFLARMSHEIRTPIHGITGTLDLLRDTKLGQEQRQYVNMARTSSETLLNVINDILDFSKIEAGKMELEDRDFILSTMLEETLETMAVPAHKKGLEILLQVSRDVPVTLTGDAGRLRQVLINLLSNAVKFTGQGEIVVRVGVEAAGEKDIELLFSVKDTGIGIPEEKQDLLFHPFEQADGSMTRKYGGSGLGLAICKQLVSAMNGRIWFTSRPGEGSIFHFTARFSKQADSQQTDISPDIRSKIRGMPLLLIDDNASCRSILRDLLSEWGFQVTEVDNGSSALKELEDVKGTSSSFRIILLDKTLPARDGFAVAEQIMQDPTSRAGTIMMLPADNMSDDFSRCQELGISHYLVKPAKASELLNTILTEAGLAVTDKDTTEQAMPAYQSADAPHLRILVAEDNATSQLIAKKTLEKVGHTVQIAANGVEAVRMANEGTFNLILMDVEMPEMNGLEATQFIRKAEKKSGRHIPILAMTAYAMKEDRERCLQAGMDTYLSKPVNLDELYNAIRGLSVEKSEESEVVDIVDIEEALKLVGGDEDILKEVIGVFLEEDYPEQLKRLKDGIEQHEDQTVKAAAHSIKGAARSFGSASIGNTALRLEEMGRNNDLTGAEAALQELEQEAKQFADFFTRYNQS